MNFTPIKVYSVGYSGAVSFSSAYTFPNSTTKAYLEVPTLSTACDIYIQGSSDGVNYRRIMQDVPNSSTVQANTFTIASAATNRIVPLPAVFPYMRIEPSTAPTSSATFNVICS